MCLTQKFSFIADPVILDLKLQLALTADKSPTRYRKTTLFSVHLAPLDLHTLSDANFNWKRLPVENSFDCEFDFKFCCVFVHRVFPIVLTWRRKMVYSQW